MKARVTATGPVTTQNTNLRSVGLTAGPDGAKLVIRAGGAGGRTVCTLKAAADQTVSAPSLADGYCAGGVHATLIGSSPVANLDYDLA